MTIDEIIAKEIEIAQEFQEVIDTHVTGSNFSLEELYCDDTEVIEEELKRCKEIANYHSTIANTMRKYQKIQEIVAKWEEEVHSGVSCSYDRMEDIKEVLEDGNDD